MTLLLDTHTFLWLVEGSPNLSAAGRTALADTSNDLFLSAASVWELAIKTGNNKLTLSEPLDTSSPGGRQLTISTCCQSVCRTPWRLLGWRPITKTLFDRILIAQAKVEGMTLVSGDGSFAPYGVPLIW